MGRPRVVVEYSTCARDLPHGGVFVPGLKLAELAECELVVKTPAQELALIARAVMVTPHGCGLELVGFNADVRAKLAELAVAATRRPSTPPPTRAQTPTGSQRQAPTPTRPPPTPPPTPRVTPQSNPAVPMGPPERPTPTPVGRAPTPPPVPRQAAIQQAVVPPPDDDEPEISVEREIEAELPDEETDARRAALRARLQTAPSTEAPNFAEVPDEDDDEPAPPPPPAPPSDEPNFAEVPDEETTGGGDELPPIDTAVRKRDDDHGGDTAIRKLAPDDEHDDHGGDTALTKLPPDHDRGDHGGDTALRKMDVELDDLPPSDTKVGKPADLGIDEPSIAPSTFEPVALEEHTPRPSRAPRPEKTIPVSDFPENRWGRIDLDDGMPRMEVRDKNSGPALDLGEPLDLLELEDAPAAKPAEEPPTTQTPALDAAPDAMSTDEPESEEEKKIAKNVHERLRGLNLAQQVKLAQTGETHERVILERMYGKTVWEALLRNPRLTGPEVARIARMGQLPRPLIEVIVNNGGWLQIPEVRRALLTNPRLGTDQIHRVLRLLPKPELKLAAMQTSYPSPVRDAARKLAKELQK